jgi:hypothetical protein
MALDTAVVAVRLCGRVEVPLGAAGVGGAAVTDFMDVEAMLARRQTRDVRVNAKLLADDPETDRAGDAAAGAGFERGFGSGAGRFHGGAGGKQGGRRDETGDASRCGRRAGHSHEAVSLLGGPMEYGSERRPGQPVA